MGLAASVASFVAIFLIMIGVTLRLRARHVLTPAHAPLVSVLITECVMPAMVFCYVARAREQPAFLELAAVLALAEAAACAASFTLGKHFLRLDKRSLGSFVLTSSFASTSLIGNALLDVVFNGSATVLGMGMVIGQFGVGVPNNTIGLWIGMRSGDQGRTPAHPARRLGFLRTPVVLAVIAGIAWGLAGISSKLPVVSSVFGALTLVGAAMPFLAALVTGLGLARVNWRSMAPAIVISQMIQLLLKPLLVLGVLSLLPLPSLDRTVTLLLAALPASPLAVVFANRYGGDTELATTLVVCSTILSILTMPLVALLA